MDANVIDELTRFNDVLQSLNKKFQEMNDSIEKIEYESYQTYYRSHINDYEVIDNDTTVPIYKSPEFDLTNGIYLTNTIQDTILDSDSKRRSTRRIRRKVTNTQYFNVYDSDNTDTELDIPSLTGNIVEMIQSPYRYSDWVVQEDDRYQPESIPEVSDLIFKPLSIKELLQTERIGHIMERFKDE